MENEIQPLEPQIEPSMDATNQQGLLPNGEIDHEGAMAKADLFKLGQYSYKLFKKLEDDTQLEAWVQAKITKAADYIASVYHYMEYEMKFSEYGKKLDDSDVLSESQKAEMKNKLMEAKSKIRDLKLAEAKKTNKDPVAKNLNKFNVPKVEDDKKKKEKSGYNKHKNKETELEESSYDLKLAGLSGRLDKHNELVQRSVKAPKKTAAELELSRKKLKRAAGPDSDDDISKLERDATDLGKYKKKQVVWDKNLDINSRMDNMKKKVSDKLKAAGKMPGEVNEAAPSAGLTKKEKSAVVKKAEKGGDIGKPGKNFDKVAKKAGGGEKGKKIAAAAMWKNIKENTEMAFGEGVYEKDEQLDELKIDKDAVRKVFNKYSDMSDASAKKLRDLEPNDEEGYKKASDEHAKHTNKAAKAWKKMKENSEELHESADLTRMKEFLTRLNG